jgi:hypothetical protein
LVLATVPPEPFPEQFPEAVEPVYLVSGSTELNFPAECHGPLADHFCHCIVRDPSDLRSHVRRIVLEYEQGSPDGLYVALLDLFLALGGRGEGLRKRMLRFAKGRLDSGQYALLRESLAKGLEGVPVQFASGTMLGKGVEGRLDLARPSLERREKARDALLEAREYLEYSQLDEARNVLERALLQEPQRAELHLELLDIYRSTRDGDSFSRMSRSLEGVTIPVPEAWRELAEYFRSLNV